MKLKCPSCSKLLQIPDSATGKVVKCPCGKQLRVPTPSGTSAPTAASPRPTQATPTSAAGASRPNPRPAPRPAAGQGGFGSMGLDSEMFDELTESDLGPVAVAPMPGTMPAPARSHQNPYASPVSSGHAPAKGHSGRLASQNKRLVNYFLDSVFIQIASFGVGIVIGIVMAIAYGGEITPDQEATIGLTASLLGFSLYPLYYILMEGIFGVTIAKLITGTRVVSEDGGQAGFGKILGRTLARFIPFEPLSYVFGDTTTGWHDTLSGTRVIDIR